MMEMEECLGQIGMDWEVWGRLAGLWAGGLSGEGPALSKSRMATGY